ncbi:hypothetical protein C2G38_2172527 [Gigaspora rosea]|uniref:Uncharacterized protein n=1 Tax=Gigaspora rosea TaxID=44941 RepID=A0A397VKG4_9GLOM|nr:hypothetical protein C2G38_2172527 [Gigaspora rosea]
MQVGSMCPLDHNIIFHEFSSKFQLFQELGTKKAVEENISDFAKALKPGYTPKVKSFLQEISIAEQWLFEPKDLFHSDAIEVISLSTVQGFLLLYENIDQAEKLLARSEKNVIHAKKEVILSYYQLGKADAEKLKDWIDSAYNSKKNLLSESKASSISSIIEAFLKHEVDRYQRNKKPRYNPTIEVKTESHCIVIPVLNPEKLGFEEETKSRISDSSSNSLLYNTNIAHYTLKKRLMLESKKLKIIYIKN